ncbi:sulfite exporter TauE/SafE family protein [Campylobacter sp. MIT 21-1685]|uniref:sulfite exporter TauE/SafE family protein n=1 Tax=unclassified Campylobacter TaxID=2593542 RepID=UPI00224AB1C3|nr:MULTISPECIES: sulfite exporter TauE/SafE family protein [unclassified Campylobacter]MCX2683473.1 sulfite exporter TauE/SafE family protein [Campylobacter sp. MIT 21-1684]MCX2751754.1 sulfite exporter TauE/SafE family protein [Campylobacter sp. MIT 21-1682]MCX2807955.1 sulfite exporter TauE/SafE family protein [Campylobacter sp. MIT 21-1685]
METMINIPFVFIESILSHIAVVFTLILFHIHYILLGIFSGIVSGLFGIGGGMIIVPAMLVLGNSSHYAIAISVFQMFFAALFGSYLNYKKKNLNLKDGLFIGIGGLLGASCSGMLLQTLSDTILTAIFLLVSCLFFLKYALGIKEKTSQTQKNPLQKNIILFFSGIFTGIFAISLGIGGGLLITPLLAYFLGYDSKKVVPIALFFVIFASFSGILSLINSGILHSAIIESGIILGLASMVGVFLGIKIIEKIHIAAHRKFLLCIYIFSIIMTSFSLLRKLGILQV